MLAGSARQTIHIARLKLVDFCQTQLTGDLVDGVITDVSITSTISRASKVETGHCHTTPTTSS